MCVFLGCSGDGGDSVLANNYAALCLVNHSQMVSEKNYMISRVIMLNHKKSSKGKMEQCWIENHTGVLWINLMSEMVGKLADARSVKNMFTVIYNEDYGYLLALS